MKKRHFTYIIAALLSVATISCNSNNTQTDNIVTEEYTDTEIDENDQIQSINTQEYFEKAINNENKLVLVDFWATWCGPCKMIAPNLETVAQEMGDKIEFYKFDVDNQDIAPVLKQFKIESIPCLILFKNGQEIARNIGYMEIEDLRNWLNNF